MKLLNIEQIGNELALQWEDGGESYIPLETLRLRCPCAGCRGEKDVMGNLYRPPPKTLSPQAFELKSCGNVGNYAVQPVWGDGHNTGLYPHDYLRRLGQSS